MHGLIHVVDDDASFRTAITRRLALANYEVRGYSSAEEFLRERRDDQIGCLLLDVRMGALNGLDLQHRLSELRCTLPIIFLTAHEDVATTVQAIKAGAEDFLIKPVKSVELLYAVERAIERHSAARAEARLVELVTIQLATLTPREQQVFWLVVQGKLNKQIAAQLGTAERTIKAHRQKVMEKMKVQSLPELVKLAVRLRDSGHAPKDPAPEHLLKNRSQQPTAAQQP